MLIYEKKIFLIVELGTESRKEFYILNAFSRNDTKNEKKFKKSIKNTQQKQKKKRIFIKKSKKKLYCQCKNKNKFQKNKPNFV